MNITKGPATCNRYGQVFSWQHYGAASVFTTSSCLNHKSNKLLASCDQACALKLSDELEIIKFYHERLSKTIAEIELSVKKLKSYEEQKTEEQGKE